MHSNKALLQRLGVLNKAIDAEVFSSTTVKYALAENVDRVEDSLNTYRERLSDLREEHSVEDPFGEDTPEEFEEAFVDLLDVKADFTPYHVAERILEDENEVPFQLIAQLKWMFKPEEEIGA